jgi:hypothetical protein
MRLLPRTECEKKSRIFCLNFSVARVNEYDFEGGGKKKIILSDSVIFAFTFKPKLAAFFQQSLEESIESCFN